MSEDITSNAPTWELYGFTSNPFDTSPLLVQGGLLPIASFTGRKKEVEQLESLFRSSGGSRAFVCGDIGVGKTSLVNYVRHSASIRGFFTPFKEVSIRKDWNADQFVLNTLHGFYATLRLLESKPVSSEMYDRLEALVSLPNPHSKLTGIQIAGFGGEIAETGGQMNALTSSALQQFLQDLVAEIKQTTKHDVIVHYNNIERLPEGVFRDLFEDLRDFFQTPYVHFVFVGNLTTLGWVQSTPRVASIMSDTPIMLKPLSMEETKQALAKRFDKLRIANLTYVVPYTPEALEQLYNLYSGNMRDILNSLSTACLAATKERPLVLDKNALTRVLRYVAETRLVREIPPRAKELLLVSVEHDEITNRHLARLLGIARSNVSKYTRELEQRGCMFVRRKDGKDKFWSVDPKIKWLTLREEKFTQKGMSQFP